MAEINGGDTTDLTSANSGSKAEEGNSEEFNGKPLVTAIGK